MTIHKILIVDDEPDLRSATRGMFELNSFEVFEAHTLAQMWITLREKPDIDVVLLDLNLPDGDGLQTCGKIRNEFDCGIIITTGRNDHIDKIIGLESGADDYVCKPIELRELVARARSVIRRSCPPEDLTKKTLYRFSDWTFDPATWKAENRQSGSVAMTRFESLLLQMLLEHAGAPVSRDKLTSSLSGHSAQAFDRSIDNLVSRVRKKLSLTSNGDVAIKSVRGIGYQFSGDVLTEVQT